MKLLAIVNRETQIVENVIVPPEGAQAWAIPNGYDAIECDNVSPGDEYLGKGKFKSNLAVPEHSESSNA